MNGFRKMMVDRAENLGWCVPYVGERVSAACNEGRIAGLRIDGVDVELTDANVEKAARIANPYYGDYSGWDNLHILCDGDVKEVPCSQCPWFSICDAMDNPDDWEDPDYPDD